VKLKESIEDIIKILFSGTDHYSEKANAVQLLQKKLLNASIMIIHDGITDDP
jgi:hypothetical protein